MNNILPENISPVGTSILIEVYTPPTESGGVVYSQESNKGTPVLATVLKAGDKSAYKAGDKIFFRRYAVDELKITTDEGEKIFNFIDDEEVLAIVK